jgi:hypothetical protein
MSTDPIDRETLCKSAPNAEKLVEIYEAWSRITYLSAPKDGETIKDIAKEDATFMQHAPVFGVKPGKEKTRLLWKLAGQVHTLVKVVRLSRLNMLTAVHPEGTAIALLFTVNATVKCCPCYTLKEDILFIIEVADDEGTLQMSAIHEHQAKTPESALTILGESYNWPGDTQFVNYSFSTDDS